MKALGLLIPVTMSLLLSLVHFPQASAICCWSGGCSWCEDCTRATPYCSNGGCNIFGCNCDGGCRTGVLCPIGAVGRRGQRVVAGPNCQLPIQQDMAPMCAIVLPGQTSWEWVHACETRGRRKRAVFSQDIESGSNSWEENSEINSGEGEMYNNVSHIIEAADANLDGKLDIAETVNFLKNKHLYELDIINSFRELDKNGDQFLSSSEIDVNF